MKESTAPTPAPDWSCTDECIPLTDYKDEDVPILVALHPHLVGLNDEFNSDDGTALWHDSRHDETATAYAHLDNTDHKVKDEEVQADTEIFRAACDDEDDDADLPAFLQALSNQIPERSLPFSPHHMQGDILADTGAFTDLTIIAFAERVGKRYMTTTMWKPTFFMADGKRVKPLDLVELYVHLTPSVTIPIFRWVMASGPYDFILGTNTLCVHCGIIDYLLTELRLIVKDAETMLPFNVVNNPGHEDTLPLFVTSTVLVPPWIVILVPVNPSSRTSLVDGQQWSTSANVAYAKVLVPNHVFPLYHHQNWVQVANMSDENVLVRRGRAVAAFHHHDRDLYTHEKRDLDVLSREGELAATDAAPEMDLLPDACKSTL
jgi:hypothetical protein